MRKPAFDVRGSSEKGDYASCTHANAAKTGRAYALIRSRTVMPAGIMGKTCS